MAAMKFPVLSRWVVGAVLATASLALRSPDAKADYRLFVGGTNNNAQCLGDSANHAYYMEAWGYDGGGVNKTCEVFTQGASAMATCAGFSSQHRSLITRRTAATFAYFDTLQQNPTLQTNWFTASSMISATIPSSTSCPGGAVLYAQSIGYQEDQQP
jgi:hypothetical protein